MARSNSKNTSSLLKRALTSWTVLLILLPIVAVAVNKFEYIVSGKTDTDNIRIDGNTISTLDTNGNLTFDMNGTGSIILTDLSASTVPYLDASKKITSSSVTPTELGYISGLSSAVQTQIDAKQARSTLTTKGDIYVATASATTARQAIGSDNQVMVADSAQTNGLKWATAPVAGGGTGITSGTSGGVLAFTASGTVASSSALTQYLLVVGGGAGAAPSTPISIGTAGNSLISGGAGANAAFAALNLAGGSNYVSGVLPNANTTASASAGNSTIVARDGSGNFSAGTIIASLTGTASLATAGAANGANCIAGSFPLGVDTSWAAESCTALPTTIAGTANQITASAATGAITLSIPSSPTLPGTTTVGQLIDSGLTASTAVVTDGSKQLVSSAATAAQVGYLSDVTSAIQAQLDGKAGSLSQCEIHISAPGAGAAGHGSSSTKIRRFATTNLSTGACMTLSSDSSTLGRTITINTAGTYCISYTDMSTSQWNFGVSVNASSLTTAIDGTTYANGLRLYSHGGVASFYQNVSGCIYLAVSDVVRAHDDGGPTATDARAYFHIVRAN